MSKAVFPVQAMTNPFTPEDWRNIFRGYKNSPEQQIGIEILRQHLYEDIRVDATLLTTDSTWYKHYQRSPNVYIK